MNRKKKKERRWTSAFLLLFPAKEHYIDKLYRNGLSDFTIPSTGGADFLATTLEQHAASVASATMSAAASIVSQTVTTATFWGGKLSYLAIGVGTAAITVPVCWLSMSVNSPLNSDHNIMNNEVKVSDTLMHIPNPIEDSFILEEATYDSRDTAKYDGREGAMYDGRDEAMFDSRDTAMYDSRNGARPVSTNRRPNDPVPPPVEKKSAPVVVKKQIIQHQTVVVRDTIFIIE